MELEHRSPKSRYLRTSRKHFEQQLGHIERRQARIRRIRQRLNGNGKNHGVLMHEKGPVSSASAYHIGKTQNHPMDLEAIARRAEGDFAAKVILYKSSSDHILTFLMLVGFHQETKRALAT